MIFHLYNYIDDDCDGEKDEGYFGDYSNNDEDYPPTEKGPQLDAYPDNKYGYIWGKILPALDIDRFRIYATEEYVDPVLCNLVGDLDFKAKVDIYAPDESTYLEVCMCWTELGDASCLDGSPSCTTVLGSSTSSDPISLELTNTNSCDQSDVYHLEVQIEGSIPAIDYSCLDWEIDWEITEQ